jgi:hypothetical protein
VVGLGVPDTDAANENPENPLSVWFAAGTVIVTDCAGNIAAVKMQVVTTRIHIFIFGSSADPGMPWLCQKWANRPL